MDREAPPTARLEIIDVSSIFDEVAAQPGVWIAGSPCQPQNNSVVEGPSIYISTDDDDYAYLLTLPLASVIGVLETQLGFISQNGWDLSSSCEILMNNGSLFSVTEELQLHGKNLALIGNEVCSFRTVEITAAGTTKISKLLRGLRGTEPSVVTHDIGSRFILLQRPNLVFIPLDASLLGATIYFKAVYPGHDLDDVIPVTHEYLASNLQPVSPTNVIGKRKANGDVRITWERRTRMSHNPFLGIEAPVGQERRRFTVSIYKQSAPTVLVRETTVEDAEELIYTAAQQTTDGTTGVALNINTTQLGDRAPSPTTALALS